MLSSSPLLSSYQITALWILSSSCSPIKWPFLPNTENITMDLAKEGLGRCRLAYFQVVSASWANGIAAILLANSSALPVTNKRRGRREQAFHKLCSTVPTHLVTFAGVWMARQVNTTKIALSIWLNHVTGKSIHHSQPTWSGCLLLFSKGGSAFSPVSTISQERAREQTAVLARELGCPSTSNEETLSCLRQLPAKTLNDQQTRVCLFFFLFGWYIIQMCSSRGFAIRKWG